jgi:flagellar hook-associated protein 3 FlgL
MRITHQMLSQRALEGMQSNMKRLADLQEQAATTKRIHQPDDDPFAVEQAMGFQSRIRNGEALLDNIALSQNWLNATDQALSDLTTLSSRAEALALKGASEQLGPEERQSLATELEGMLEQAIGIGNTRNGDQFLFAGFKTDRAPFEVTRDPVSGLITGVTYAGDAGAILREVEPGVDIAVNVLGDPLFSDVFAAMTDLRSALQAAPFVVGDVTTALTAIKGQTDRVLDVQAGIGTKVIRTEMAASRAEARQVGLQELLSKTEDADMAEVITKMSEQQFVYQTALAVNAQMLKMSLMDYLK